MKRILLTSTLAFALAGSAAFALQQHDEQGAGQHHRFHERDPHKAALKLGQRLNLSQDQTARLEPILADRQRKMVALRSNTALSEQDRRAQFRAIHEESRKQFAAILTPEQMQQMKAMHKEHGRHHGEGEQPGAAS